MTDQNKIIESLSCSDIDGAIELIYQYPDIRSLTFLGLPIMMAAVMMNHYNLVKAILQSGVDPNILHEQSAPQCDLLDEFIAAWQLDDQTFEELTELGYKTPIHIAVNSNAFDIVKLLLESGANVNQPDLGHCTPLHWACVKGNLRMVELLLKYGADPNAKDLAMSTPLHEAVRKNQLAITKLLLQHNARSNIQDLGGTTALEASKDKPLIYQELLYHTPNHPDIVYHS